MAIHKNLPVGSILFQYHEVKYDYYKHRYNKGRYNIEFCVLYIYNRRERTSGASVPISLIPTLDKLGIRHHQPYRTADFTYAVGCRTFRYYTCSSFSPYPTASQMEEAKKAYEQLSSNPIVQNQSISLVENEFMKDFHEKKLKNKDAISFLLKPIDKYIEQETYIR